MNNKKTVIWIDEKTIERLQTWAKLEMGLVVSIPENTTTPINTLDEVIKELLNRERCL